LRGPNPPIVLGDITKEGNVTAYYRARRRGLRWSIAGILASMLMLTVSSVALGAGVPTDPDPDLVCAEGHGFGLITKYVTAVNTPADSKDWWVSVQFEVADDGDHHANCEISLGSYELPGPDFSLPQTLFAGATGVFGVGTHNLTVPLPLDLNQPGCFAQYDFVFGPLIEELTVPDHYGDRQIRARIVGSGTCPADPVDPPDTPDEPEGGTQGGTSLPNTAMAATSSSDLAPTFALLLVASLSAMGMLNVRAVRARRAR
jgi:hypothetical protein